MGSTSGFVSVRRFSKPFLLLLVLASLRVAIPGPSWLTRRLASARRRPETPRASARGAQPLGARPRSTRSSAVLSVHVVYEGHRLPGQPAPPDPARPAPLPDAVRVGPRFAETFAAWDSGWYFDIAQRGYYWSESGQSSLAFFPLYPLLMRALAWPFGGGDRALWIAGVALSYGCLLPRPRRAPSPHRDALRRRPRGRAPHRALRGRLPVRLLLHAGLHRVALPADERLGGGRGLRVALGLGRRLRRARGPDAAERDPDRRAARPAGPRRAPARGELARRAAALALVPLGFATFCAFAYRLVGRSARLAARAGAVGLQRRQPPVGGADAAASTASTASGLYGYFFSDPLAAYYFLHGVVALAFVALVPSVFTRLGLALGAYVAVSLYVPLSGNALEGIGRYAATLFPVFMLLGGGCARGACTRRCS